ncbi:MAG: GTP cyclohydrolase I [Deltaproteobacteria bacterium]|nr:GTP cyclohydrolase I [Deltaproteobacteria bacterium]
MRKANKEAAKKAVRDLLVAFGEDLKSPDLEGTPERVAESWLGEFLTGYAMDPREALGESVDAGDSGLTVIRDISFLSVCPHHLLPYRGVAHIAYYPGGRTIGFSRIVRLLDGYARRLTLQERITREVPVALCRHLKARAAACVLVTDQTCLQMRGVARPESRVVTTEFVGEKRDVKNLRAELGVILRDVFR